MTRDDYAKLKAIVAGALSRDGPARQAFLVEQCAGDSALAREAASLLAAAIRAEPLYESPDLRIGGVPVTFDALGDTHFAGTSRYVVRRRIGAGGMGIVYEAEDRERGRVVALKTIRSVDAGNLYRLKREFRSLADVAHPNLVSLYDLIISEDRCFFTMELVDGVSIVDFVRLERDGRARSGRARRAFAQLIEAVEELHRRGLRHGDIKPSNVLVTPGGRAVVLDFGLTSGAARDSLAPQGLAGTPAYLSPEQCGGALPTPASDWYAVGATLYHALSGQVPFDGPIGDVIARKTSEDPPPVPAAATREAPDLSEICMAFLRRDPRTRLSGREALERLSAGAPARRPRSVDHAGPVFVGRESSLRLLESALAIVTSGRPASVFIYGPSGIGKSTLVQQFLDGASSGRFPVVLRGRCHEHEAIPYNALDGVIDSLAGELASMPAGTRAPLLPDGMASLVRLFPVLRTLGVDSASDDEASDPIRLRRAAFEAFREFLDRLARSRPVIVDIDDFHWADADSVRWLTELLRPPSPPLLLLVSFRSEEFEAKPFLRALIERVDIGARLTLPLAVLSADEVGQLARALLPPAFAASGARDLAALSGGNPFLAEALARHLALGAHRGHHVTLEEMLERRLERLPAESRAFLEALAITGRPELPARILEVCGSTADERQLVARLRAEHLVRTSRSADRVELYHDRIREALAARVDPGQARRLHERLADVLAAHGDDDPEALFEHYRAAGQAARAAAQAVAAAEKASRVLAFDLAAAFYRAAIELQPSSAGRLAWSAGLGRALENSGRPVEAADAYLAAIRHASGADAIEWKRKAAELLLIGGQIDRGLLVIDDVLRTVGVRLARGPRTAVIALAYRRWRLARRGLAFTPRSEAEIAPEDLLRIDACWSISAGMAMVDPIRAAAFNVRQLERALEVGDPYRVARALALEAGFAVVGRGAGSARSAEFSERARALSGHIGRQYVTALSSLWAGIAAFLTGRWQRATELCGQAVTTLRDECTGVIWELNMATNFFLGGLVAQGELREVAGHLPGLIESTRERGNLYLELELSTRMILAWLAGDDPDEAERRADGVLARWSHRGFQRQHYNHVLTRVQTALYRGRPRDAWQLLATAQRPLRQSLFLRVQHTRIEAANYRIRCALAMAADGDAADRMRQTALREAARIDREHMPWSTPIVALARATVACQQGDVDQAATGLRHAAAGFDAADMRLYAAASRRRLGVLLGGDDGRALVTGADAWMTAQGIRNIPAMTRLATPGFEE